MAEQKEKTLILEKEQLILSYKNAIATNLKTYNETLKICNSNYKPIEYTENQEALANKTIEDLNKYYVINLEMLALKYVEALRLCNN